MVFSKIIVKITYHKTSVNVKIEKCFECKYPSKFILLFIYKLFRFQINTYLYLPLKYSGYIYVITF